MEAPHDVHAKPRRSVACTHCRAKKIRCNGDVPCANCSDHDKECIVTTKRRRRVRPRTSTTAANDSGQLKQALAPESHKDASEPWPSGTTVPPQKQQLTFVHQKFPRITQQLRNGVTAAEPWETPTPVNANTTSLEAQEDGSVYASDAVHVEYYGPRCFLSFCSRPAMDWGNSRLKSSQFSSLVSRLTTRLARMLKMGHTLSQERAPEPPPEILWEYTKAYFEDAVENSFGIVDRGWFESRLGVHLRGSMPDDRAWYALRNIIWASGSRIFLSRVSGFSKASRTSWEFFENALSAHTDVLFSPVSIIGLQALVLMAYYSEGMGKASLQYVLCSNAMRLACSKGLHRQASPSWKISDQEAKQRNWLFWSIYCLEKQICTRCDRPSVMDDDEISCQVPEVALSGRPGDMAYCDTLIEMMRLASTVRKRLLTARALQQSSKSLVDAVQYLNSQLEDLKHRMQQKYNISLDESLDASRNLSGLTTGQAQLLQYHYISLTLDINTTLAYPWSAFSINELENPCGFPQVQASREAVAKAARSAIIATRQIKIDGSCTAMVAVYVPVYSFMNLFIHILRDPDTPASQSDFVLLDMALGYFSHLEFASDLELSFPYIRDLCNLARGAFTGDTSDEQDTNALTSTRETSTSQAMAHVGVTSLPSYDDDYFFGWTPDNDAESWNTFLMLDSGDSNFLSATAPQ